MSHQELSWSARYEKFTHAGAIRKAIAVYGEPLLDLGRDTPELATAKVETLLYKTFVPTRRVVSIIQSEVARAHAHSVLHYEDPKMVLANAYAGNYEGEGYAPTCISGLAGSGKTQLRKAMQRIFSVPAMIKLGPGHGEVPLNHFTNVLIGSQKSISQILRPLARPEIANRKVRISEPELISQCAQWQSQTGGCLFGVDELQFLAQSSDATTQVTKVLLAFMAVLKPWFFVCNYSLVWKLKARPQEATQRLLSRPKVLHPDLPDSEDWSSLIDEYERLLSASMGPQIFSDRLRLWNYTAGLKRLLVQLITTSYLTSRERGSTSVTWADIERTYRSASYQANREDVEALIANSIQGGLLRQDLKCPFMESEVELMESYKTQLRLAMDKRRVAAAVDSALNANQSKILNSLREMDSNFAKPNLANVVHLGKKKKTAKNLSDAARRYTDALVKGD